MSAHLQSQLYIGLMSGTSCDALDIVGLQISNKDEKSTCKLHFFSTYPYPSSLKNHLLQCAIADSMSVDSLAQLEIELMHVYAYAVNKALAEHSISASSVVAMGVHGQTIRHQPNAPFPYTLQLCEPAMLAKMTQINVVSHFRQSDVANGGQGAPLAPIFHQQLLQQYGTSKYQSEVVVNLGGIANLSCVDDKSILAFDSGPANTLLDLWVRERALSPKGYDENGKLARSGKVNSELLKALLQEPYFSQKTPKSTGRELFNLSWLQQKIATIGRKEIPAIDVLTTLTHLTTQSIIDAIPKNTAWDNLWLCGGGVYNDFLLETFKLGMKKQFSEVRIGLLADKVEMDSLAIEAGAWAWLAYLYTQKSAIDLASITGAKSSSVLGRLSLY